MAKSTKNWNICYFLLGWTLLPVITLMIRTFGFQKTCWKILGDPFDELPKHQLQTDEQSVQIASCIQKSILQAGRFWPDKHNNCLQRASVACFIIRAKKVPCRIKLGVIGEKSQSSEFAHAWIEVLGQPIGESYQSLENYFPFQFKSKNNV